jgi:two-component system sensor kinase FixL
MAMERSERVATVAGERALRELVSTTQDGVVFIDANAKIVVFNPAAEAMFGYRAKEVMGRKVNMLMASPFREAHDGYLKHYETTGEKRAIGRIRVVSGQRKSGEEFPLELSVTEMPAKGRTRYAAFLRDISETVALKDQLVERERLAAMGSAAAILGHEIGNPLNNMSLQAQLLKRTLDKDPKGLSKYGEDVDAIMEEIQRLVCILEEFRQLARRGRTPPKPTRLGPLVHAVAKQLVPLASQNDVQISVKASEDARPVMANADRLKQVFLNLCKNAIEAMPDGGDLTLEVSVRGDYVVVDVTDTGTGIEEGIDVFEAFQTTKENGTGLGLAVVKQIVVAHQGIISWRSQPDSGTVFTMEFRVPAEQVRSA